MPTRTRGWSNDTREGDGGGAAPFHEPGVRKRTTWRHAARFATFGGPRSSVFKLVQTSRHFAVDASRRLQISVTAPRAGSFSPTSEEVQVEEAARRVDQDESLGQRVARI